MPVIKTTATILGILYGHRAFRAGRRMASEKQMAAPTMIAGRNVRKNRAYEIPESGDQ
jgi:hypothetical protein